MTHREPTIGLRKGRILTDDELLALAGMQRPVATSSAFRAFLEEALDAMGQAAWMSLIGIAFVLGFAGGLALV